MDAKESRTIELKFDHDDINLIHGEIKLLKKDAREITNRVDSLEMQLAAINKEIK